MQQPKPATYPQLLAVESPELHEWSVVKNRPVNGTHNGYVVHPGGLSPQDAETIVKRAYGVTSAVIVEITVRRLQPSDLDYRKVIRVDGQEYIATHRFTLD